MGIRGLIILEPQPALAPGPHVTSVRADLCQKPLWVGEEIYRGGGGGCLGVTVRLVCSFGLCVSVTVDVIAE